MARSPIPDEVWALAAEAYRPGMPGAWKDAARIISEYGYTANQEQIQKAMQRRGITEASPAAPEDDYELTDDDVARVVAHERQLESLRREASTWKRKYEESIKGDSLDHTIADLMREYRQAMPIPKLKGGSSRTPKLVRTRESICLLLSDLHVGETVSGEAMHGINRYDIGVFMARMERLAELVEDICFDHLTGYEFEELVIYGLGDLVNGMFGAMHDELIVTQAADLMETVYGLAYVLVQFIARMRQRFARVRSKWAPGNHGRMSRKPWAKGASLNWDMVVPQIVSSFFAGDPTVEFDIPDSFFFVDEIRGQKVLGFHGHQVKGWSGIPWYGIKRFDENLTGALAKVGVDIDHIVMGHFHTEAIFDRVRGEIVSNPCIKGADEFTLSAGFRPAPAGQTMFGLHDEHGITHRWRLDLQNAYEPTGAFEWWPGGTLGGAMARVGGAA